MDSQTTPNPNNMPNPASPPSGADLKEGLADKARQAGAVLTDTAQRVGDQAKEAASSLASEAQERMHGYMDQQVTAGADLAGRVANAIKAAADELGRTSPALGGVVRDAGERVQDLSRQFRGKSVDEVFADTSDFVRRKPALVFGAAAAFGFLAYRILNAGMMQSASHGQRYAEGGDRRPGPSSVPSRRSAGFKADSSAGRIHAD
jgi:ElaB/YqjD/DUF883 family membrane-anchored ribosome-binding protein